MRVPKTIVWIAALGAPVLWWLYVVGGAAGQLATLLGVERESRSAERPMAAEGATRADAVERARVDAPSRAPGAIVANDSGADRAAELELDDGLSQAEIARLLETELTGADADAVQELLDGFADPQTLSSGPPSADRSAPSVGDEP
jgi:hypothetical protein